MVLTASRIVRAILISAMVLSLAACSFAESKDAAEQSANVLYHTVATGDMDAVMDLYSDRFYQETSREEWHRILHGVTIGWVTIRATNWSIGRFGRG